MSEKQVPTVAILLSTYNGEKFLAEQLDSLINQSYSNFIVIIRDDGSSDDTISILNDYCSADPSRIHLVDSSVDGKPVKNLGASGGFSSLMQYVLSRKDSLGIDPAYMMFCDQDDVWLTEKIEHQMDCMLTLESEHSQGCPILLHSDLRVVAEDKSLMADSFVRFQGLEVDRNSFSQIAISNLVTGCTALFNESLARKALPVSKDAIMHDWWLAMVASAFGILKFIDQPLTLYRQHGKNTIGAKEHNRAAPTRIDHLIRVLSLKPNRHLQEVARQARGFAECYGDELASDDRAGLAKAMRLNSSIGFLQRVAYRRARNH